METTDLLIEDTPKDTTWAASSWFPGFGQGFDNGGYLVDPELRDEFDIFEGETLLEADELVRLRQRQSEQKTAIASFRATRIFVNQFVARSPELTNGVPYIEDLNEGKSDQARANFVPRAIQRGLRRLELRANTAAFAGGRRVRFI